MIALRNLEKSYQSGSVELKVLKGINLDIQRGEFVAIMGQSGSGKTTLMNIIGCIDSFDSGSYQFLDAEVDSMTQQQQARLRSHEIGFVFQSFNLINQMTALRNVELPMIYAGRPKPMRRRIARTMLELVGLADRASHLPSQLSGGQQQRVAIARALVNNPKLIVADEPTGSLDSETGQDIMNQLGDVHQAGTTILVVTHEKEVARHARRIVTLADGCVISDRSNASGKLS